MYKDYYARGCSAELAILAVWYVFFSFATQLSCSFFSILKLKAVLQYKELIYPKSISYGFFRNLNYHKLTVVGSFFFLLLYWILFKSPFSTFSSPLKSVDFLIAFPIRRSLECPYLSTEIRSCFGYSLQPCLNLLHLVSY